jgi:hypothetical protein
VKQRREGEKLEVRERPDRWAPSVGDLKEKEKGKVEVGRAWVGGPEEERPAG